MSKHLTVEEEKKQKPTLLFVDTNSGQVNTLLNFLIEKLENDTRVYALTQKKIGPHIHKISPLSVHFLDKLSDDLDYAVIFLDEVQEKKKVLSTIRLLTDKKTKVILLLPHRISGRFIDVLIQCKIAKNVTVGLLGDTFGNSNPGSPISKIIYNAFTNQEIIIAENNALPIFPISDIDVALSVSHLLFGNSKPHQFFYLFYKTPQTLLSMAHLLKRAEQDLSITFQNSTNKKLIGVTQEQTSHYLQDRIGVSPYTPQSSFIGFEKSVVVMQDTLPVRKDRNKKQKHKNIFTAKKSILSSAARVARAFVIGLLLYIVIIGILFFTGIVLYKKGVSELSTGNTLQAKNYFETSNLLYGFTRNTIFAIISLSPAFPGGAIKQNIFAYDDLMSITDDLLQVSKSIKSSNPHIGSQHFQELMSSSLELYFLTQRYDISSFKKIIQTNQYKDVSRFLPLSSVALSVLGYDTPKTYLLLFQNNNELRPTGGFIGSVGQLTLKNGGIQNIQLQDVYDLDGQLKGHVDPPFIVRRFLQPHQYLRDSNFAMNFEDSASLSAFLYNVEGGRRVDGVVAIDTDVLKKIVEDAGPISIPGYSQNITGQNVVDSMQETIQKNNFPGSTQKKQILETLLSKITVNLESDKKKQMALVKDIIPLIAQKHILFSFVNNASQKAFTAAGFTGSMLDLRLARNTLPDFLSINEANIGVNKANEFVTRKVTYSAFLKPAVFDSDVLLEYSNTSKEDYKAYVRVIVPKGARLLSVVIDGVEQKIVPMVVSPLLYERRGFTPPLGLEVNQEVQDTSTVFGFVTTVPRKGTQRIRLLYENTGIVPAGSFTYSLLYIKQPGTSVYPLTVSLQADESFWVNNTDQNAGPVLFDGELSTDREITAKIIRTK